MPSGRSLALLLSLALAAVATFVWPTVALLVDAARSPANLPAAPAFTERQMGLLLRGLGLSAGAAVGGLILGAALAAGLVARGGWLRAGSRALACFTLLTPTYLIAYAWSLPLLPEGLPIGAAGSGVAPDWLTRDARAVLCLSIWLSPIAGLLLAAHWDSAPRRAYRQALLDAAPAAAVRAALGLMAAPALAASLLLASLAFAEYAIPHLCLRPTWNTELLAQLQLRESPALLQAWSGMLVTLVLSLLGLLFRPNSPRPDAALSDALSADAGIGRPATPRIAVIACLCAWLALLSPVLLLLRFLQRPQALMQVWSIYADDWADGAAYAAIAAALTAVLGLGWLLLAAGVNRPMAAALAGCAALAALAPPAIVGEAHLLAAGSALTIRDTLWPIALLGAARFAIIPIVLCAASLRETRAAALLDSAAVDGAARDAAFWTIALPRATPSLLLGALAAGVLTFGEISASVLVIPPGVGSVARSLLNEIHFGRNDDVIALSLWTLLLSAALSAMFTRAGLLLDRPTTR
ncbi:MAG: hypothetical protein SF069_15605 [Phycisphaerae bacterium]|nr:hypothetical protein [Phycisphaerae bacterium]